MVSKKKYMKRNSSSVIAVQLNLKTEGFKYKLWGGAQTCKPGDWVINNAGETYTIDQKVFESTYKMESPGIYRKVAPVWANISEDSGSVKTSEGETHYQAGDYLVYKDEYGMDCYAVSRKKFESMYAPEA